MNISDKLKKTLLGIFAVVFIVVFAVWMFLTPRPEHIKDTNGADNYALQTINKGDVVKMKMGTRGSISQRETQYNFDDISISGGIKYSSKKFTGVYCLYTATIFKGSDIYVMLPEFKIKEGNFAFYIVYDGEVVGQVEPNEFGIAEFTLNDVKKTADLSYVIAGESANFSFVTATDYN